MAEQPDKDGDKEADKESDKTGEGKDLDTKDKKPEGK
jgi:hypothetical protein